MFSTVARKFADHRFGEGGERRRALAFVGGACLGERREKLRLEFLAQVLLEIRKAAETQPRDEAQDRGSRDAGAGRELRNGVEAGEGVVAQKQVRGALLARREGVHLETDALGEARRVGRREARVATHTGLIHSPSLTVLKSCIRNFRT